MKEAKEMAAVLKNKKAVAGLLLALVVIVLAVAWGVTQHNKEAALAEGLAQGTIDLDSLGIIDIQEVLNERADESGINVFINSNIVAKTAQDPANVLIQNLESNKLPCKVYITRNDTGEQIYESDEIPAGYKVEAAKLQVELKAGVYPCNAAVHVLAADGSDKIVINVATTVTILK